MIVVRTQIKEIIKESGSDVQNISADYLERIDEEVRNIILKSVKRAQENGRRTLMGKDI